MRVGQLAVSVRLRSYGKEHGPPLVVGGTATEIHVARQLDFGVVVVEDHWVYALSRDFPWTEWTGLASVNPASMVISSLPRRAAKTKENSPLLMANFRASNRDIEVKPPIPLEDMRALCDPVAHAAPAVYHIVGQAPAGIRVDLARDNDDGVACLV